jgi:hypothetical protein
VPAGPARPRWWGLSTVFILGVVLLAVQHSLVMSTEGHEFSQLLIVFVIFGLMFGWINKNEAALADAELESDRPAESRLGPTPAKRRPDDDQEGYLIVYGQGRTPIEASGEQPEPGRMEPPAMEIRVRG